MKNYIKYSFMILAMAFIFASCSSRQATMSPSVSRTDVSGMWTVSNVSLEGFPAGYSVGRVFDIADYQDFQGSTWDLNGNYKGTITLTNGTSQEIYWSINNANSFQFKKLMPGEKPKNVTSGYELQFGDISKETAVFKTPVRLTNGQVGYINFTFTKA